MGYKVGSLVWRNDDRPPKLSQYLLFQFFYIILSICIYHQLSKAQSRIGVYSGQDPSVPLRDTSISLTCQLRSRPSPQGICHITISILCLLLVDKTALIGISCLRGYKRTMSRFSPTLHCCRDPMSIYLMGPGGSHLKGTYRNLCLLSWKGVPRMDIDVPCPTFKHPSNFHSYFHGAVSHIGIILFIYF